MKNGLRISVFFCFTFILIFNAFAVVQSTWVKLTSDSRSLVKESVTVEVNKQDSFSLPEQAASNILNVQKEKDDEDTAYKADMRSLTSEFNRTKQRRDDLTTKFQGKSQEVEETQKSIQNLMKGIENCNSSIARFEEDIRSQLLSFEKWLKTEKQGEAAVAVIYTRGFKDVAHDLEKHGDQASAPLLAESMGIKIRAHSQVINNVLAKDIVQATAEGTSKPINEEPVRLELDKTPAGTVYLRLKRYELFPFQYFTEGRVKPGKEAGRFKAQIVTSGTDLEAFLKANGYSISKGDLARLQQVIEDARENNRTADSSLGSQIATYQSRIRQLKEKIEDQRSEKGRDEKKLAREQEPYQKLKGEATAAETAKGNAEREFEKAQLLLQEKKRVRNTIIVKEARAVPKGSEAPADAVAAVIIDKLEEVRNDARTQHSTAATTVVNYQVASEQAGQAMTNARILAVRLISFVNEGESGIRVQIAFRVRTDLNDNTETVRQTASREKIIGRKTAPANQQKPSAPLLGSGNLRAQGTYPSEDLRHKAFIEVIRDISVTSAGTVNFEVLRAGAVVPAFAVLDAVAKRTLDAAWVSGSFFYGKDHTFGILEGAPFGLDPGNYFAWRRNKQVSEIVERLYRRHGVVGLACGVTAPHGDIWAKKPITKPNDIKGMKIRATGFQVDMFTKMGAVVNALPGGEIVPAMDRGLLDAATYLDPRSDLIVGFADVSKVYMVAQLQGARGLDLIINAALWDGLQPEARNAITTACSSSMDKMVAESTRIASEAIQEMQTKYKVKLFKLPNSILAELRSAWNTIRSEEMAKNATFAELAATMSAYDSATPRPNLSAYGLDRPSNTK